MRKKLPCLLLAGALALGLAACDAAVPDQTSTQPVETDAPTRPIGSAPPSLALGLPPEPTDPPAAEDGLPDRDYRPWQTAYMDFLSGLARADEDTRGMVTESGEYYWPAYEGLAVDDRGVCCLDAGEPMRMTLVMALGSESYSLHDVDGDGVPELFVKYGSFEAAYTTQCYTYRDGQVVCVGEFSSGHSSLYTCPGKSAVVRSEGHMGYHEVYEYPMEEGVLTEEREIFSEEKVDFYTATDEIVPGAEYIPWFYTRRGEDDTWSDWRGRDPYSLGKALLLPICDYYDGPAVTGDSTEQAREAILAALKGEAEVYGASGDHFNGDIGLAVWEEYIRILMDVPNAKTTARVAAHFWLDLNGDGQEECVVRVESEIQRDEETWGGEELVILSFQDGTVYAYTLHEEFLADGTIWNYSIRTALSFWRDQCYEYAVEGDSAAQPVKWLDGSPAG